MLHTLKVSLLFTAQCMRDLMFIGICDFSRDEKKKTKKNGNNTHTQYCALVYKYKTEAFYESDLLCLYAQHFCDGKKKL